MSDPMQEIRASFFVECDELLEALQDGLAALEGEGDDPETINIVFRAVHSIKGGAGAFGLDDLVGFAHAFETVLDEMRAERLDPTPELLRLLFRSADTLSDLVRAARDQAPVDAARVETLLAELEAAGGVEEAEDEPADFQPMAVSLDLDLGDEVAVPAEPDPLSAPETLWSIRFAPHPELYAAGHEPLFLLRALAALGRADVTCRIPDAVPSFETCDPGASLLAWDIRLATPHGEAEIRDVFEFAEGLCELSVVQSDPEASVADLPEPVPSKGGPSPIHRDVETDPSRPVAQDLSEPMEDLPDPSPTVASVKSEIATPDPAAQRGPKSGATVRVDLDRIERLVNLVGELVINQAMLSQSFTEAGLAGDSTVASGLDEFLQLTRDIQDSVMMIRAQPVKSLFQRMGRIVRESSDAVGKSVRLVSEGEATEIDKTMIERLSDPLMHMIRNAVDHGLETPDLRRAAHKPEQGTVTLTAAHRSGRVVIEVRDDGAGINRQKVQSIAEDRGLIPRGLTLGDAEIDNLLFLPGFSTAGQVSSLSGRGVGMDVVKSAISALGGRIAITSSPGRGTSFSISLPLTLAVLDGMVVETAGETLVVPLGSIVETLTLRDEDLAPIGGNATAVRIRDSFVTLVDLAALLGYAETRRSCADGIALLISQDDGAKAALVVDRIVDQRQVVIKGLEESYGRVPGVAAATILGDGRIALILDPSDLIARPPGHGAASLLLTEAG